MKTGSSRELLQKISFFFFGCSVDGDEQSGGCEVVVDGTKRFRLPNPGVFIAELQLPIAGFGILLQWLEFGIAEGR